MKKIRWSLLSVLLYAIIFVARRKRAKGWKMPGEVKSAILSRSKSKCPACKGFGVVRVGLIPDLLYHPPGQTHTTCPVCGGFGVAGNDLLKARADALGVDGTHWTADLHIPNCPCQLTTVSPCEACHAAGEWQCYTGLCYRCKLGRVYDETESRRHGEPMPKPDEMDSFIETKLSETVDIRGKTLEIQCVQCDRISRLTATDLKTILLFLSGSPVQMDALKSLVGDSWSVRVGHGEGGGS